MPKVSDRRKRLKHALIDADMTMQEFAAQQHVTLRHLDYTLRGRASKRLNDAIDAFIAKHGQKRSAA